MFTFLLLAWEQFAFKRIKVLKYDLVGAYAELRTCGSSLPIAIGAIVKPSATDGRKLLPRVRCDRADSKQGAPAAFDSRVMMMPLSLD